MKKQNIGSMWKNCDCTWYFQVEQIECETMNLLFNVNDYAKMSNILYMFSIPEKKSRLEVISGLILC